MNISELDLVVAGTKDAVLMVESEAKSLPEEVMLGAVLFGHQQMQVIIDAINHLAKHAAKPKWGFEKKTENKALKEQIKSRFYSEIKSVYQETQKQMRVEKINELRGRVVEALIADENDHEELSVDEIKTFFMI